MAVYRGGPGLRGNLASSLALFYALRVADSDGLNILGEKRLSVLPFCVQTFQPLCCCLQDGLLGSVSGRWIPCRQTPEHLQAEIHFPFHYFHMPSLRQLYVLADLIK